MNVTRIERWISILKWELGNKARYRVILTEIRDGQRGVKRCEEFWFRELALYALWLGCKYHEHGVEVEGIVRDLATKEILKTETSRSV